MYYATIWEVGVVYTLQVYYSQESCITLTCQWTYVSEHQVKACLKACLIYDPAKFT